MHEAYTKQYIHHRLIEHRQYIREHGEDMPEIRNWRIGKKGPLMRLGKFFPR